MASIKPTFTLTANKSSASSNPGPLSVALSLSTSQLLTVDTVQSEIVSVSSGSPTKIIDGSATFGGAGAPGSSIGGFLYMKNITASGTNHIFIGVDTGSADDLDDSGADAKRLFSLKPGEFAFLPYDYNYDINVDADAASQTLEYWLFDRG
tara:strand:+ start:159 stop:611 length:453 start_codon:yes stop_codon:yes gene_type:complete